MDKELIKILRKLAKSGIEIEKSKEPKWEWMDLSRILAITKKNGTWIKQFREKNKYKTISKRKFKRNS
ncbi:MAG: hypothetical protein ACFFG0_30305, partial [Candidatus Thorarchaeota archaeon]